jgi:D-amino-acid dehydrogenase
LPLEYEYRQNGLLYLYASRKKLEAARHKLNQAGGLKIKTRLIKLAELLDLEPCLAPDLAGAIWYKDDAMLRPESFIDSLAQGIRDAGSRIIGGTEVYDLELSGARATALLTTAGRLAVDRLVLANGAWLGLLTRRLGKGLPIEGGMGISLTFDPIPQMPRHPFLLDSHGAVTPFAQGLRITGLMRIGGQDMELSPRRVKGVRVSAGRYIPGLKKARVRQVWRGLRPCLPDGLPIMGSMARFKNVWLAGGHDQKGISLAPVTGMLMARMLCGQKMPQHLAAALSPSRFGL